MYLRQNDNIHVENCLIHGNTTRGIYAYINSAITIKDCTLYDNGTYNVYISNAGSGRIDGCSIYGGVGGTTTGLAASTSDILLKNSVFGASTQHSTRDILLVGSNLLGRNVVLNSTTQVAAIYSYNPYNFAKIEDDSQTHEAYMAWYYTGTVEKSVAVERSGAGGTAWSMLGTSNSYCGSEQALFIIGDWLRGIPIYLDGTAQTITVYAYADSTGGGWTPNASEFYIEIEHYEGAADWQVDVSSDTFAAEDQWESFSITLTPGAAGVAYLRAVLKDYAAGGKIYIDPKLVIS